MIDHVYVDGRCARCGQTPPGDDAWWNLMLGRTEHCLTDQQLEDMKTYYAGIAKLHQP